MFDTCVDACSHMCSSVYGGQRSTSAASPQEQSTLLFQQFFTLVDGLIVYGYRSENNFQKLVPSFRVGHTDEAEVAGSVVNTLPAELAVGPHLVIDQVLKRG